MSPASKSLSLIGPAVLLALFAAGSVAGLVFALPVPAPVVGLAFVALGLRIGVMAAALEEPAGSSIERADVPAPFLRASNG
jgi:putative effector of murein hydrolase LrgA (UPF0299 family)